MYTDPTPGYVNVYDSTGNLICTHVQYLDLTGNETLTIFYFDEQFAVEMQINFEWNISATTIERSYRNAIISCVLLLLMVICQFYAAKALNGTPTMEIKHTDEVGIPHPIYYEHVQHFSVELRGISPFVVSFFEAIRTLIRLIILHCIRRRRNRDQEDPYEPVGIDYWQQKLDDGTIKEIPTISKPPPPLPTRGSPKQRPVDTPDERIYAQGCPNTNTVYENESEAQMLTEENKQYARVHRKTESKDKQYARVHRKDIHVKEAENGCCSVTQSNLRVTETVGKQYARIHRVKSPEGVIKQEIS